MPTNYWKIFMGCFAVAVLMYMIATEYLQEDSQTALSLPLTGKVFVIDPGHGGHDGGAVSASGIVEKEISLEISLYLRDLLHQAGAFVIMTRERDEELASEEAHRTGRRKVEDLKNRVRLVNESEADFLFSIHLNSISAQQWRGAQTFYDPRREENQRMALLIQEEIINNLENTTREAKKNQEVFLLRHAQIPGVMVEVGFLSNPEEAALLETEEYQKKMAISIYQGILRYYAQDLEQMNNQ